MNPAAERAFEDIVFARTRQAIWDQGQYGPFPWMLKSPENVLRDAARAALLAAGFTRDAVDEVICDHEDWE